MKYELKLLLFLCLTVLLFFSCQVQYTIAGKYSVVQRGKYPKIIPATFYVTLYNDSTFDYNYQFEWYVKETSFGTWKINERKNSIILQSYIQDLNNVPIIINESTNNKSDSSLFVLNNPLFKTTQWTLRVNGLDYLMKGDSMFLDKSIVVNNFYIIGYEDFSNTLPRSLQDTIQSEKYNVKDTSNNVYHISFPAFVDYNIFHYKPLQDSLQLHKHTLLFEGIKLKRKKCN